jgi:glycosyltransferase involved in cell wall biosynthesis
MRIAHFVQRYPPALGGSEAYFARLSRCLAAGGDGVVVFTTNAIDLEALWSPRGRCSRPGRESDAGVEVRRHAVLRLPGQRYWLKALSLLLPPSRRGWCLTCNPLAFGLLGAGRGEAFDVVHATAFPYAWPILCARRLARRLGVPFLLTPFLHLGDPDDPRDPTRRAFLQPALVRLARSADRLFVQTEGERRALLDLGISPERLVLQGLGVDLDECTGGDRKRTRAAWGAAPDEAVVGCLANHSREKGSVDLLKAAARAWDNKARFHLVLAGPEMPNFTEFWRRYPMAGRVRRLGVVDERGKRDFLAALDVFALPSRADSFGLVLLEAWANGAANVGYRAGGVGWVIRHGVDGLLVRCGDVGGLAAALTELAVDGPRRRRLGEEGRRRVAAEFRWPDKLDLVRRVYREVAARGPQRPPKGPPRPRSRNSPET